ncbi:MAG: ammonium transporter, partial [Gammaproteobacteria bacterium]|nr:ammonium transporter [Gammaproteobacteria bacterium]
MNKIPGTKILAATLLLLLPSVAAAQDALSGANTAWILTSTALVLFMTLPGLALFYGGLVRTRNVLSVLMQCFAIAVVVSILWLVVGYSIAFGPSESAYWGGLSKVMFSGVVVDSLSGDIPETVFASFQMTFAIITPALIVGAFAERIKFSAMLLFSALWTLIVYFPVANWVWGGGWLGQMGLIDFAGGTVVHVTAGIGALVFAIVIGQREGFPTTPMMPHNLTMSFTGAGMLWVGWFGFNAGSALAADGSAGMAMFVTHISAATGALTWMTIEW